MGETTSKLEELEKIHRAANIGPIDTNDNQGIGYLFQLSHLMGYRQKVAQAVIDSSFNEDHINLFNYTNEQIKKVLGI